MTLHANTSTNVLYAGGTLGIKFDSISSWSDADDVVLTLFEVDDASPIESVGRAKVVARFRGTLANNKFTLAPAAAGHANPELPAGSTRIPKITVTIDPAVSADVSLPDAADEHAIFELGLQVEAVKRLAKGQAQKTQYIQRDRVFVRWFAHDPTTAKAPAQPRPVVAFILGKDENGFFTGAEHFWKANADAVFVAPDWSMQEVVAALDAAAPQYGPYGQINLVAHGRARSLAIKLFANSEEKVIHRDKVRDEWNLEPPHGVDGSTEVVFRACNVGNDTGLLDNIRKKVFGGLPTVRAPKYALQYWARSEGSEIKVAQWLLESLVFDVPSSAGAPGDTDARLREAYARSATPGSGGNPQEELPLFTTNDDWLQVTSYGLNFYENAATNPDGTKFNDVQLVEVLRREWKREGLRQKSSSWETEHARWEITVKSKLQREDDGTWWMEVTRGTASPRFRELKEDSITVGSASDAWCVTAAGVADYHADVVVSGDLGSPIEIKDRGSGTTVVVIGRKKVNISGGRSIRVPAPCRVIIGDAELLIRRGKRLDVMYSLQRQFVDRRRELKRYIPGTAFDRRDLIIVNERNPNLFGSSP